MRIRCPSSYPLPIHSRMQTFYGKALCIGIGNVQFHIVQNILCSNCFEQLLRLLVRLLLFLHFGFDAKHMLNRLLLVFDECV